MWGQGGFSSIHSGHVERQRDLWRLPSLSGVWPDVGLGLTKPHLFLLGGQDPPSDFLSARK